MVDECQSVLLKVYFRGLLYIFVVVYLGGGANLLVYRSNEQRLVHIMYIHFVGMSQTFPQGYKRLG
jgi:hypothetical protein